MEFFPLFFVMLILFIVVCSDVLCYSKNEENIVSDDTYTTSTSSDCVITCETLCNALDELDELHYIKNYIVEVCKSKNNQVYMRILYKQNRKIFMRTETYKNKKFLFKKAEEWAEILNTKVVYNDICK